jgi:cytochrome c-type biogenesis protein CcmE
MLRGRQKLAQIATVRGGWLLDTLSRQLRITGRLPIWLTLSTMDCDSPPRAEAAGVDRGMPKNLRFVIGVSLVAGAIGYLIITAVRNTAEYYLTVNEVKARQAELSGQMLRVAGRVVPGTIAWDPATLTLKFAITQPPGDAQPSVTTVAVTTVRPAAYKIISRGQPKPDMFAPGRDVIVEGLLSRDNTIQANQVLTSCPSKYSPRQN